jgi:NAD(P)-dependent dehydrogenase (short-subunit alcohol dehydrogenase family)
VYGVSKHAVTRLTEGLYHDLQARGSRIGVSVLCPGTVNTRIIHADRNRPAALRNAPVQLSPEMRARREFAVQHFREHGMAPEEVGRQVLEAVREQRFYVLTHPWVKPQVERRMRDIVEERAPTPVDPREGLGGGR